MGTKALVYRVNHCRLSDLRRPLYGKLAPHPSNGSHFKGKFLMLDNDLYERKSEEGLSGLIN
jgi:hypothetical protein